MFFAENSKNTSFFPEEGRTDMPDQAMAKLWEAENRYLCWEALGTVSHRPCYQLCWCFIS